MILVLAVDQTIAKAVERRRSKRYAARRRARLARLFLGVSALLLVLALVAGFLWGRGWWHQEPEIVPRDVATLAQRVEARQLLDRAIEARHAELSLEAKRLAMQARSIDPDLAAADLFVAEMALGEGNADITEAAARRALTNDRQYAADAHLILALNAWMLRGMSGVDSAAAASQQMLAEAAEVELSNGAVRFFAGDLQRSTGQSPEAHRSLLGALYRQEVWHSAALLTAKLALTVDQADGAGGATLTVASEESEKFGTIAVALGRSLHAGVDTAAADAARACFTRKHLDRLAADPALRALAVARPEPGDFLPFGEVAPPAVHTEAVPIMPWDREAKALDNRQFQLPIDPLGNR
jgi:hypothetical protein